MAMRDADSRGGPCRRRSRISNFYSNAPTRRFNLAPSLLYPPTATFVLVLCGYREVDSR
jgi:hypothetical protein